MGNESSSSSSSNYSKPKPKPREIKPVQNGKVWLKQEYLPTAARKATGYCHPQQLQSSAECILSTNDRRRRAYSLQIPATDDFKKKVTLDGTRIIVRLKMKFGDKYYSGTGFLFPQSPKGNNALCVVTAAHNVVQFDPLTKKPFGAVAIWCNLDGSWVSASTCAYYPKYEADHQLGNDVAFIKVTTPQTYKAPNVRAMWHGKRSGKNTFMLRNYTIGPSFDDFLVKEALIYGYPGEKNGELWGMKGQISIAADDVFSYSDIDTTGGQSGSPIIGVAQLQDSSSSLTRYVLLGVHTNGGCDKNYGTMFTWHSLQWIGDAF